MQNDLRNSYDLSSLLWIVAVLLAVLFSAPAIAGGNSVDSPQQSAIPDKITIKGTVVDKNSLPVAGATVVAKDRPALGGTVTDHKGHFTFAAPLGTILQISFVGYAPEEKAIDAQTEWIITLQEDNNVIDDIVVVGYGVQKKESVIGAISQVKGDELVDSGTTNLKNALAGKVSGMSVISSSGAPGEIDSQTSILLRGLSSWKGNSPLVMVDGIERDMASLSPNEVASISVLKDASATAVYGSKGANGVILITTKTGVKGKPKFKVNVEYSANTPMFPVEHVDAPTIINMANIAYRNAGSFGSLYSDDIIKQYADQSNPLRYPDVNWYELMTKDFSSSVNADFSMVGGSNKVRYYIGVGYVHDGSILKEVTKGTNYQYDKFNYRVNLDWDITKSTSLSFKFGGATQISRRLNSTETSSTLFSTMYQAPSVSYPAYYPAWALGYYPDPDYPTAEEIRIADNQGCVYENPYSYLMDADYRSTMTNRLMTDVILKQDLNFITKGLSFSAKVGLTSNYSRIAKQADQQQLRWDIVWDAVDLGNPQVWRWEGNSNYVYNEKPYAVTQNNSPSGIEFISYYEASLNYARKFSKKHNVTALALYNQRQVNSGSSFPKRNQSFVGRLTYDYKGKYLFEASMRADGTSRFAKKDRWGYFPSVSAGWRFTEEQFMEGVRHWWDNGKIRLSYGALGNQQVSNYLYLQTIGTGTLNYLFDDSGKASYASVSDPMSSNLTWETVYTYNLGLDLSFLQNRLSFTGDFFIRDTKDMLTQSLTLPSVYGAATPTENCADLRTKGWELSITWRDQFKLGGKPFHYALTGQIGDYQTEITKYNNPTKLFDSYYEGKKLGEIWGYHVPKLFDTDEEAAAYQVAINNSSNVYQRVYNMQNNLGRLMAGDVMFEDRDGSGSIGTGAGTVDDPGDMMIIGNTTPRYSYSFRIEASWNGFDISAFFQGVGKRDWYPTANKDDIYGANQFWQLYGYTIPSFITYDFMDDVWSEQNPGGYFPRLRPIQSYNGGPLGQNNDRYLQSVAYLRFKNLTIGYTLPVLKKYLSKLRIYVSGENLCYWSPLKKHCKLIDPELAISSGTYKGGTGTGYTMPRTFSFGVDITF